MNSPIAFSINAGGCTAASLNPQGIPTLIGNLQDNHFVTPLEIGFGTDRVEIGQAARRYLEDDPTIFWADNLLSRLGTDVRYQSGEQSYRPYNLLESVVQRMQHTVEHSWLGPFRSTVVAVSADLNHLQRSSLMRAFRTVGVDDIRLVDSSITASFMLQPAACEKPVLICELQNDRVQASLIQVDRKERSMLAVCHSRIDAGESLYRVVSEELKSSVHPELFSRIKPDIVDRNFQVVAKSMTESILNSGERNLHCRRVLLGSAVDLILTAEKIGAIGERYFEKAGVCLAKCLDDAGRTWDEIEAVCFIGELGGLPEFVEKFSCFSSIPSDVRSITNARWASVFGAALMGKQESNGALTKVVPLSLNQLGLRVRSTSKGGFSRLPLISDGAQLPTKAHHIFKTSRIDQERLVLEIVEGTDSDFQVVKIAEFGPLFPQSERHPIEVRFQRDEQGILKVTAVDGITKEPIHSCLVSSSVGANAS
jgi:molecular chaperone DnaK (HSP70)